MRLKSQLLTFPVAVFAAALLFAANRAEAQPYTWNAASASLWGTPANWSPSGPPGSNSVTTNADVGQFSSTGASTTIQFNFGTIGTPYYVGTISFLSTNTVARTFGSNASTAGTLVLNGTGANSLILDNQSAVTMTVASVVSGGTGAMTLQLTAANSTINASGTGAVVVSANVTEATSGRGLTKTGSSPVTLSGTNSYTGVTTSSAGIL
jgi:autotransporter-associated beta strand protein